MPFSGVEVATPCQRPTTGSLGDALSPLPPVLGMIVGMPPIWGRTNSAAAASAASRVKMIATTQGQRFFSGACTGNCAGADAGTCTGVGTVAAGAGATGAADGVVGIVATSTGTLADGAGATAGWAGATANVAAAWFVVASSVAVVAGCGADGPSVLAEGWSEETIGAGAGSTGAGAGDFWKLQRQQGRSRDAISAPHCWQKGMVIPFG